MEAVWVVATITGLVGLFFGLLLEGLKERVLRSWLGPKIQPAFSPPPTDQFNEYVTRTVRREYIREPVKIGQHGDFKLVSRIVSETPEHYVRIKVYNDKARPAKNCHGYLVKIHREVDGKICKTEYSDSIPLKWSYLSEDAPHMMELQCDVPQYLNLLFVSAGGREFAFDTSGWPNRYENIPKQLGVFIFTVAIAADGAKTATISLRFTWMGDTSNFSVEQFTRPLS